jgi:hypothetical protein
MPVPIIAQPKTMALSTSVIVDIMPEIPPVVTRLSSDESPVEGAKPFHKAINPSITENPSCD